MFWSSSLAQVNIETKPSISQKYYIIFHIFFTYAG